MGQEQREVRKALRSLGAALKARRESLSLTQEEVADRLGIVPRHYQKIESGTVNVTVKTLVRLSVALGTSPRKLL